MLRKAAGQLAAPRAAELCALAEQRYLGQTGALLYDEKVKLAMHLDERVCVPRDVGAPVAAAIASLLDVELAYY